MTQHTKSDYELEILPLGNLASLCDTWTILENRVRPPVFLRWLWISTWLDTYMPNAILVKVKYRRSTVGLGLFCKKTGTRRRLMSSRRLLLHQTGEAAQDQIWMEYNGLLALPMHEVPSLELAVAKLIAEHNCDEVHLSMLPRETGAALSSALPTARISQGITGYLRHLGHAREQGDDILAALSPNTRYQIRRSIRGYTARYGEPRIEAARDVDDALAAFHEAGIWHRQRWPDSGFDNPAFTAFHETLIKRGFDHNNAMLYRVIAGDHPVGVFFYLRSDQCVHFYLQGVAPESDGKLKPGLMSHALLMQHFMEQGYSHYDFMGGDSQYKQQLADETIEFMTIDVHNGALRFRLEDCARRARNVWRARLGRKDA